MGTTSTSVTDPRFASAALHCLHRHEGSRSTGISHLITGCAYGRAPCISGASGAYGTHERLNARYRYDVIYRPPPSLPPCPLASALGSFPFFFSFLEFSCRAPLQAIPRACLVGIGWVALRISPCGDGLGSRVGTKLICVPFLG